MLAPRPLINRLLGRSLEKAWEHLKIKAIETQQLQHADTEHARAMRLKNETEAPAGGAATEHTETEFHIDDALAKTLGSLQAIDTQEPILIRVIDHACSSEYCISYRLVAMLRSAHWKISADIVTDVRSTYFRLLRRLVPRKEKLHVTMSSTHICGGHIT